MNRKRMLIKCPVLLLRDFLALRKRSKIKKNKSRCNKKRGFVCLSYTKDLIQKHNLVALQF